MQGIIVGSATRKRCSVAPILYISVPLRAVKSEIGEFLHALLVNHSTGPSWKLRLPPTSNPGKSGARGIGRSTQRLVQWRRFGASPRIPQLSLGTDGSGHHTG